MKIGAWKKIVCRRKSESQTDPDKQIHPDKKCDCVFTMQVCKKQGLRQSLKCYWLEVTRWINICVCLKQSKNGEARNLVFGRLQDFSKDRALSDIMEQQKLQQDIQDHPAHLFPNRAWLDQL